MYIEYAFTGRRSSFFGGGDREQGMVNLIYLHLTLEGICKEGSELEMRETSALGRAEGEAAGGSSEA